MPSFVSPIHMMKHTVLLLAALIPQSLFSQYVEDPFANPDPNAPVEEHIEVQYRVSLEYLEMPLQTLAELMASPEAADEAKLKTQADALVKKGEAKLIEFQTVICAAGCSVTSESVHEVIYPTEYEPAEIPHAIDASLAVEQLKEITTGPTPTTFETRKVGSILGVELQVGEGTVSLKLSPEIITHTRNYIWSEWKGSKGESNIQMPDFYTLKFHGQLSLALGKPALVTSLTPHDKNGSSDLSRKILVFAKVQKLEVK